MIVFKLSLVLIMTLSFVGYTWYIVKNYGILDSLSAGYKKLKEEGGTRYSIFTWFAACTGGPMLFFTDIHWAFAIAGTCGIVLAVAANDSSSDKIGNTLHVVGASGMILASYIGMILGCSYWFGVPAGLNILITLILTWRKINNLTFWIELIAAVFLIPCYLVTLFIFG